jgi:hypothetical protein
VKKVQGVACKPRRIPGTNYAYRFDRWVEDCVLDLELHHARSEQRFHCGRTVTKAHERADKVHRNAKG